MNANDTELSCRNTINVYCVYAKFHILPKVQNSNLITKATVSKCKISAAYIYEETRKLFCLT